MAKAMLGKVPLSRWQGLRDDLEQKVAGPGGERWADELGWFLRRDPKWQKSRYQYGDSVWTLGRVRVFDRAGHGRWVNGIYREYRMTWLTNSLAMYSMYEIFDAKTFEFFEYAESVWPSWDSTTFKGFCAAVASDDFARNMLARQSSSAGYTIDGSAAKSTEAAHFNFSWWYGKDIQFDIPEIRNEIVLPPQLWQAVHETLRSANGKIRLSNLVN